MRNIAILLLLVCSESWGAPLEVKGERGAFIVVRAKVEGGHTVKFHPIDAGLNVFPAGLLSDPLATVVSSINAGRYRLLCYSGNEDGPSDPVVVTVVVGDAPAPVPPGPGPGPTPPTPPVPPGKRSVLIIHESTADTPEFGGLIVTLRNGKYAEHFAAKGHRLFTLDDDDKDEKGSPTPMVEKWRPHFTGMTLPAVFILDEQGALVHKQPMPATADAFLEVVKAHGG
jgi:hypothetical protein